MGPVLVSAEMELIFFLVAGVMLCFGFSMQTMLIILTFLVVAKKSKTSFSLPCSANEQVCRSWEGAQPGI